MDPSQEQHSPILTVSQLTQAIKMCLESTFPFVYLQGEISNFKIQSSGHLYFSLKDAQAQISVVMFRNDALLLRTQPKNGDHVIVKGEINVYPSKGNYQLIIRELSYVGLGELLQRLEALKIKLHQMGWFRAARKKKLPRFPKRIGVVTSPTGSVIQDILNVLTRRFSGFHLILNPVKVQGEGAAQEIARAIEQFNEFNSVDVMIVGRGGGSLEDLWPFNEEIVAAAIFNSKIPIISAVGHETDHCIADYVADVRAPTPSAAAEIVIGEKEHQLEFLATAKKRIRQMLMQFLQKEKYCLNSLLKHPLLAKPKHFLENFMQRLDDQKFALEETLKRFMQIQKHKLEICARQAHALKPHSQISYFKQKLTILGRNLNRGIETKLQNEKKNIQQIGILLDKEWNSRHLYRKRLFESLQSQKKIDALLALQLERYRERLKNLITIRETNDPKNLLNRGYSILFNEKGESVINSVKELQKDQIAKLRLSDGEVLITINKIFSCER